MIAVSFERELREAFNAGQRAAMAKEVATRHRMALLRAHPALAEHFDRIPKTYEAWIASIADRPATVRG